MIELLNRHTIPGGIYIGRPGVLGNPYQIGKDGNRATVINKYRFYLEREVVRGEESPVYRELMRLAYRYARGEHLRLACWCHPLPCHGDVVAESIVKLSKELPMGISERYKPSHARRAKVASEARNITDSRMRHFKSLFYGLRAHWWKSITKSIWAEARDNGELDEYVIAPGFRNSDGSWSRPEYDEQRLHEEFWSYHRSEFYTEFEVEFWSFEGKNLLKATDEAIERLLDSAVEEFGDYFRVSKEEIPDDTEMDELDETIERIKRKKIEDFLLELNKESLAKYQKGQPDQLRSRKLAASSESTATDAKRVPKPAPKSSAKARKRQQQLEAQRFLAENPEFAEDPDAFDKLSEAKAISAEEADLPEIDF